MANRWNVEVTDTFGGDANYCWVHRHTIPHVDGMTDKQIVRAAKALEGWTGRRVEWTSHGDMIEVRPRGLLQVMFITFSDMPEEA